ncbi:MAG: hypothetical protein KAI64_06855, partial [Thermoplasmata archaeon]|nr:hypothetical protein [Thermoplasmata archaeon]
RIALSTNSGRASAYGVLNLLGFNVKKDDPRLRAFIKDVHKICGSGFNMGLLDDEHYLLALKHFGNLRTAVDITRCDVTSHYSKYRDKVEHDNSCVLKVAVNGVEYKAFEDEENGPVAVNFKAMKEVLKRAGLPTNFHLINYEVGLPKEGGAGAGSKIQTYITYVTDKGEIIRTSGFHEDIIVSSRESLVKAAIIMAEKERRRKRARRKK